MASLTKLVLTSLVLSCLIIGCNSDKDENIPQFPDAPDTTTVQDPSTLAKIAAADSIYALQQQFNTLHQHGKDLAVHAHQNIPRKRRMLKHAAAIRPQKMEAYKRARERREQRLKEQQIEIRDENEW